MQFILKHNIASIVDDKGNPTHVAPSDKVAKTFFAGGSADLGLLPPAVRWVSSSGFSVVLERPPQEVTVVYKNNPYTIPVPWTVWGIEFNRSFLVNKSFLFARPYPLSTVDDELFVFPLPNMTNDCGITLPNIEYDYIGDKLLPTIEAFWARPFTGAVNDLIMNKDLVPEDWLPHLEQGIDKYLVHLSSQDIEDITFADLRSAKIQTFGELTELLDEEKDKPNTVMEFFENIVIGSKAI